MNTPIKQSTQSPEIDLGNALFHYTSAAGLIGIFESRSLWGTAHYCTNDESEMSAVSEEIKEVLKNWGEEFFRVNPQMKEIWIQRDVDTAYFTDEFSNIMSDYTKKFVITYITCFCSAHTVEVFQHGLLSQWRGYGTDGGYAIQFNKKRLIESVKAWNKQKKLNYRLSQVSYQLENSFKCQFLKDKPNFIEEFKVLIPSILKNKGLTSSDRYRLVNIIDSLIDYRSFTKNNHFEEEREWRLRLAQPAAKGWPFEPAKRYSRNGLIVSYISTPSKQPDDKSVNGTNQVDLLDCIDRIIVGPGPRMPDRVKGVEDMIRHTKNDDNASNIKVDASTIPFTRS